MRINSIRDVAAAVRGRRIDRKLSQAELARRAGVSRKWIYELEGGKRTAETGLLLRVLNELGLHLELSTDSPSDTDGVDLDDLLSRGLERDER